MITDAGIVHQSDREDLAAAVRWAHRIGLHEGVLGHFRLAVPGPDGVLRHDRFLVHPLNILPEEASASELILMDLDGNMLEDEGHMACPLWTHRHLLPAPRAHGFTATCRIRPHWPSSMIRHCFRSARQHSLCTAAARISALIAEAPIVVMGGHGVVVTGPNVAEALYDPYLLETAARLQVLAMSSGAPLRTIAKDTIDRAVEEAYILRPLQAERYVTAAKRVLDGARH